MPPYYDRYADVMRELEYGFALWHPDPFDQYDIIRLGDVGNMNEGKFIPGWHMWLDASTLVGHSNIKRINVEKPLHTESISEVDIDLSLTHNTPTHQASIGIGYQCNHAKGGLIALKDGFAISRDLKKYKEKELSEHLQINYADIMQSCRLSTLDEIVAITGTTMTRDWDNLFFDTTSHTAQASLEGGVLSDLLLAKTNVTVKHLLTQNVRRGSGHHHEVDRPHTTSQQACCDEPQNQCIFIRTLRIRKRKFSKVPKVMKGGAEPKDLDRDPGPDSDIAPQSIESDDSEGDDVTVFKEDGHPDTTSGGLYDEIFEYLFNNSDGNMAIVHDRDVDFMLKHKSEHPRLNLPVAVQPFNGVVVLYHDKNPLVDGSWKVYAPPSTAISLQSPTDINVDLLPDQGQIGGRVSGSPANITPLPEPEYPMECAIHNDPADTIQRFQPNYPPDDFLRYEPNYPSDPPPLPDILTHVPQNSWQELIQTSQWSQRSGSGPTVSQETVSRPPVARPFQRNSSAPAKILRPPVPSLRSTAAPRVEETQKAIAGVGGVVRDSNPTTDGNAKNFSETNEEKSESRNSPSHPASGLPDLSVETREN